MFDAFKTDISDVLIINLKHRKIMTTSYFCPSDSSVQMAGAGSDGPGRTLEGT